MTIQLAVLVAVSVFVALVAASAVVHLIFRIPYVPSKRSSVHEMVKAAELKPCETVFDLGCGDGRLLIAAEKQTGVRAIGFEIAPLMFLMALIKKSLAHSKIQINFKNFFSTDLSEADVIFCYLFPEAMEKLLEKIKNECKPGTRIISNTFKIQSMMPTRTMDTNPKIYVYRI